MPTSGRLCNKCRSGLTSDGDTWCRFCSSVGALNESSRYRYQSLAFRSLAEEVVVQCCRQVQALSQLDRQVHSERTSLSDRLANAKNKLEEVTNQVDRSATPKSAGGRPQQSRAETGPPAPAEPARVKSEPAGTPAGGEKDEDVDFGSESDYDESEEEEEREEDKALADKRPKSPELSRTALADKRPKSPEVSRAAKEPRSPSRPPIQRTRKKKRRRSRSRKRGRRGGSRHQAQYRGLQDPNLQFHKPAKFDPIDLGSGRRWRN